MAEEPRRQGYEADFRFRVGELTWEELKVTAFTGTEGVSSLFEFTVELTSRDPDIDFEAVVGKPCVLEIAHGTGLRFVNGIVRRFARTGEVEKRPGETERHTYYRAEIVPFHWLLSKRYKSRIFQTHNCDDMTIPGIVRKVLDDAGISEDMYRFALEYEDYVVRDFVVQYRESDLDFIARLLEHEGIFYFFEHTADGHVMVFGDSGVASVPIADESEDAEYPFREPTGLVEEKEFVWSASDERQINIGAVCLEDYDFKRPAMELRSTVAADQYTSLEFSDYPGEYVEKPVGQHYAQVRLEEYQCTRHQVEMRTTVRALIPGYRFTLIEHPAASMNCEYLVLGISHRATQAQSAEEDASQTQGLRHDTTVRAIPADVPYRPPRTTRKPVVVGSQTALVTGPSGEEIYTDDDGYGRVKVQFHWDLEGEHDENSSCWIRVSHGWAGGNYGMIFLPRVGQEVIVDFLEGNPDRPIITGRVYNNDNMPPYTLPDEKTKSTIHSQSSKGGGGFNEFRFEDKKGEEQIFMHGEKDLDIRIKNDERDYIGRDKHEIIKRHQKKKIEGSEGRAVGGTQAISVGGDRSVKVEGESAQEVQGNYNVEAEGDYRAKGTVALMRGTSAAGVAAPIVRIPATSAINLVCGGSFVTIDASGVAISGPSVKINSGGSSGSQQSCNIAPSSDPAAPDEAATGDPGVDFTYQQQRREYDPLEDAPTHDEEATQDDPEKTWIGIRLWDDNGQPLAGERYQVLLADGTTVARGRLDANGEKEIRGIDPGSCQVMFPDLDGQTWEAGPAEGGTTTSGVGGTGAGGGGGAGAGGGGGGGGAAGGGTGGGGSASSDTSGETGIGGT